MLPLFDLSENTLLPLSESESLVPLLLALLCELGLLIFK